MRFLAVALAPPNTADLEAAIARLLAPYDQALPAPPYKRYLSAQATKGHATRLGVAPDDMQTLATRMNEHYAATMKLTTHFQGDAQGIFVVAESNPNGRYARWSLNDPVNDVWPVAAMPRDLAPRAVITPDGQWHALFSTAWGSMPSAQETVRIVHDAYALIDRYPDYLAARLECHV
jgi:hypothetical protein